MGSNHHRADQDSRVAWSLRLGGVAALIDPDGGVHVLERRVAALLALLACDGEVTRARAAGLLWPDAPQAQGRHALRQQLLRLRKLTGSELIDGGQVLRLSATVQWASDGDGEHEPLLAGHDYDDSEALVQWVDGQRQRLRRERVQRWRGQYEAAEREQDYEAAVQAAQCLVQEEPKSEEHHRQLMRAHYLRGDIAAAQSTYEQLRQMLHDEYRAEPSAATEQLARTLRHAQNAPERLPALPVALVKPPQFVGRTQALARTAEALRAGSAILVEGEAGLGKTRMLEELTRDLLPGLVIVSARPGDARVPFSVLARLMRAALALTPAAYVPKAPCALATLLPEFGPAPPLRSAHDHARLLQEVRSALAGLTGTQFAVDDLHFADLASVEAAQSLIAEDRSQAGAGLRILAYRPSEVTRNMRVVLDALIDSGHAMPLALPPLDAPAVAQWLTSMDWAGSRDAQTVQRIVRHTGGNPFFILETLKAWQVSATDRPGHGLPWPPSVSHLLERRLRGLSESAQRLAWCASVAGADLDAALASHVLAVQALDLTDAWRELEDAQVLTADGFVHDLIAEATRRTLPRAIAEHLHGEVASYLESRGQDGSRIAQHWIDNGNALRAVPYLRAAGERAWLMYRADEAADRFEEAARICRLHERVDESFDLLFRAANLLGGRSAAEQRLRALAEELARLARSDTQRARAGLIECAALLEYGPHERFDERVQHFIDLARRVGDRRTEADLIYAVGARCYYRRDTATAVEHLQRSLELHYRLREAQPDDRDLADDVARTESSLAVAYAVLGRLAQGLELCGKARASFQERDDRFGLAGMWIAESRIQMLQGDLTSAMASAAQSLELGRDVKGALSQQAPRCATAARNLQLAGRLHEALRVFEEMRLMLGQAQVPNAHRLRAEHLLFLDFLGRRDLALSGLSELEQPVTSLDRDAQIVVLMAKALTRQSASPEELALATGWQDFGKRCDLLLLLARDCPAESAVPMLSLAAREARDCGAWGAALSLQARLSAVLARAGQTREAAANGQRTWQLVARGVSGVTPFSECATDLHLALQVDDPLLAAEVRAQGSAWVMRAAASLPPEYRASFLNRNADCRELLATGQSAAEPEVSLLKDASSPT